jgi:Tol biopolymer transport system component
LPGAGSARSKGHQRWGFDWVAWAPGTSILFDADGTRELVPDGRGARRLLPNGYKAQWSPDRRRLAVVFGGPGGIAVAELGKPGLRSLTRSGFNPVWSPTGDRIAYNGGAVFDHVRVVRPDGSGDHVAVPLRFGQNVTRENDWSPDGRRLVFSACLRPVQEGLDCSDAVFVAELARPRVRRRISPGQGTCPDWSSAGAIAYRTGGSVAVVPWVGARPRLAIRRASSCPAWSPDGSLLAAEGPRSLIVARADGRSRRRLTTLPPSPIAPAPAWSPDGRHLAVARAVEPRRGRTQYRLYVVEVRTSRKRIVMQTRLHR